MVKFGAPVGLILTSGLLLYAQSTPGYLITTVAGEGTGGYSGDGGPAITAGFADAEEVTRDLAGNLYVADFQSNRVRKITPQGIISTVAGNGIQGFSGDGGLATSASLNSPTGVAVDTAGNLYIGDEGNGRVRKVTPQGIISTLATGGPAVGTDQLGNLYYSNGDTIQKVTPRGATNSVATLASSDDPRAIAVDALGNIYVADGFGYRVWKVTPQGIVSTVAGNGVSGFSGDGGPATAAELSYPNGVAADASGNLYISDATNNRVRKVTAQGIISTIAGQSYSYTGVAFTGDGGPASSASIFDPRGVATDPSGDIYVSAGNEIQELVAVPASTTGCQYSLDSNSQSVEGQDRIADIINIFVCKFRLDRQRQGLRGYSFTNRKIALLVAETGITRLEM
jgi:trimeric autotransporter adhesin